MYYSYRQIDGYNSPVNVILSRRGLGKTFGKVLPCIKDFAFKGDRFIYVVETLEQLATLTQNKGEKFFANILDYLRNSDNKKDKLLLEKMFEKGDTNVTNEDDIDEFNSTKVYNQIRGGTISINGETAGYIISFNDFGNMKRNNFVNIKTVIIDEFIPEKKDIRTYKNPYKLVSLIQSIARLKDIKIYMLGNTVDINDPVLDRLGLTSMKPGEIKVIKDDYGIVLVAHYVNNKDYLEFSNKSDKSVSGRFAKLMKETSLDENSFKNKINDDLLITEYKNNSLMCVIHGFDNKAFRVSYSKDGSDYYITSDYGNNKRKRYCLEEKYISNHVIYNPSYKELLLNLYSLNKLRFDTSMTYNIFKDILKIVN